MNAEPRIFPDWEQIRAFRNPLTEGETTLARYLDNHLPAGWEIFVQPYMNGDRPDIVILNPAKGMMIYEVKDWAPTLYSFTAEAIIDKRSLQPVLKSDGQPKTRRKYYVSDARGRHHIPNPHGQVQRYRSNLINLYVPNIGQTIEGESRRFALFKVGLYFHNMTTEQAKKLIPVGPSKCTVAGHDLLEAVNHSLAQLVPAIAYDDGPSLDVEWYKSIRFWLMPPYHAIEQGTVIRLSPQQQLTAKPSPKQHQRLKGVAGSGKTLVIAQRAAGLAAEGKRVLIVTYNITLWHYIRDHVQRVRKGFSWDLFTFKHFHGLCADYMDENSIPWPEFSDDETDRYLSSVIPQIIVEHLAANRNSKNRVYDAVLIDEGQDFCDEWYKLLCHFLTENNELVFVADDKQNIYNRDSRWVDGPMTGFRGPWRVLKPSYRLPPQLVEQANKFAAQFLEPGDEMVAVESDTPLLDPKLIWKNLAQNADAENEVISTVLWLVRVYDYHPGDIVVLIPTHEEGWKYVQKFESLHFKINHVFEDEHKRHYHKKCFWMGSPRLKLSTIHSFKGWELTNVVILTPDDKQKWHGRLESLLYTSMTRARRNIVVLNRNPRFVEYGNGWPVYPAFEHRPALAELLSRNEKGVNVTLGDVDRVFASFQEALEAAKETGRTLTRHADGGYILKQK